MGKKAGKRNYLSEGPDIIPNKQSSIVNMLKELKKTMFEEMKEGMMIMSNPIENISIKIEMIKNNQMDIMKLKSTIKLKVH